MEIVIFSIRNSFLIFVATSFYVAALKKRISIMNTYGFSERKIHEGADGNSMKEPG